MFIKLIFRPLRNSCCKIPHMVSFWREMYAGSPEDKSRERWGALLRVCMHTRAPRCLAADHRHIHMIKWIAVHLLLRLPFFFLFSPLQAYGFGCCVRGLQLPTAGMLLFNHWELFRSCEAVDRTHTFRDFFFLSNAKKTEGLSWGVVMSSKGHFLLER